MCAFITNLRMGIILRFFLARKLTMCYDKFMIRNYYNCVYDINIQTLNPKDFFRFLPVKFLLRESIKQE